MIKAQTSHTPTAMRHPVGCACAPLPEKPTPFATSMRHNNQPNMGFHERFGASAVRKHTLPHITHSVGQATHPTARFQHAAGASPRDPTPTTSPPPSCLHPRAQPYSPLAASRLGRNGLALFGFDHRFDFSKGRKRTLASLTYGLSPILSAFPKGKKVKNQKATRKLRLRCPRETKTDAEVAVAGAAAVAIGAPAEAGAVEPAAAAHHPVGA